jgi:signal transduction histidine kinase
MAASYVTVSAAAVLVVEAVLLAFVLPQLRSASESVDSANDRVVRASAAEVRAKAQLGAAEDAAALSAVASRLAADGTLRTDAELLAAVGAQGLAGTSVARNVRQGRAWGVSEALTTPGGRIVAAVGEPLPPGTGTLPGVPPASGGAVWASAPVTLADPVGPRDGTVVGAVKLRLDVATAATDAAVKPAAVAAGGSVDGVLLPGLVVLGLLIPVGLVFGLLSTGPLIRRIRRLADGTAVMAAGNLGARIPVSGDDEVGRLEQGFNAMAERLEAAVGAARDTAATEARREERTRIARELHDSVSQHLFSLNLLAGGLRRALPAGSELRDRAESMERTVDRTMREMRAMLLELRPVALEDAGLVAALDELCGAYEVRLGIRVSADVGDLSVAPAVEHAVLRVVQEALANAARHGEADLIEVTVAEADGHVDVSIRDHGRGFDPARAGERHGMGLDLMRERMRELGGTLDVESAPDAGTTVRARIRGGVA